MTGKRSILFFVLVLASGLALNAGELENDLLDYAEDEELDDVKDMLRQGADINACDDDGRTALMWSAINDDDRMIDYLVEQRKIDLNRKDDDGNTALMHAVKREHERSMNVLLANDADVFLKNEDGHSPLDYAIEDGLEDLIPRLRRAENEQRERALRSAGSASGDSELERQKLELERRKLNLEKEELHKDRLELEEERHRLKLERETLEHERRRLERRRRELEEE